MARQPGKLSRRRVLAAMPAAAFLGGRSAQAAQDQILSRPGLPQTGEILLPAGNQRVAAPLVFSGRRINLRGAGANASVLIFEPSRPAALITLETPGRGGHEQSRLEGLGFLSNNDVDKTAIRLVNVASVNVEKIGIAGSAWRGAGSIGIRTEGREMVRIRDCDIGCARPIVIGPNATHPTLGADFFAIANCTLISTGPGAAVIDVEDGTVFSNLSIRDTALVGGRDGFRYVDRSSRAASVQLEFQNVRTEQGRAGDGWSFDIRTSQSVQDILFQNVRCDSARNGIRIRGGHRITLINTTIDQRGGKVALDIEFTPATVLTIIGSFGQTGGAMRLVNARKVTGVDSQVPGPFGPFEIWVYDPAGASRR